MPADKFYNEKKHPEESDLKLKIGKTYRPLDETLKSMQSEYEGISLNWKYSKTSGWYITCDKKKKRLFYLFPLENDFTVKIVFNDKSLQLIRRGSFPKSVQEMLSDAMKYPEGTLLMFTESNYEPNMFLELLKIKLEN
ncbi:MAG: DUF3788 family protein [Bacteroidota bacterium]